MTTKFSRIAQFGAAALMAASLLAAPRPAAADPDHGHGWRGWHEHGRDWVPPGHRRHWRGDDDEDGPVVVYGGPAYYQPAPVVVVPPPPRVYVPAQPSLDIIFPIHIR